MDNGVMYIYTTMLCSECLECKDSSELTLIQGSLCCKKCLLEKENYWKEK